jgi:tetratricopeptide (TPR) repeat protein
VNPNRFEVDAMPEFDFWEAMFNSRQPLSATKRQKSLLDDLPDRGRREEDTNTQSITTPRFSSETPRIVEFAFSGREAEVRTLRESIEKARGGRGSMVFVTGEAGVGKTRLAGEVSRFAEARGFNCLNAKCPRGGSFSPYLVWVDLLRTLMAKVSAQSFFEMMGNLSVRILSFLPEWGDQRQIANDLEVSHSQQQSTFPLAVNPQVQVFDAMAQFLLRIADRGPLLLILDDFQWCDQASLDLLQFLNGSSFRNHSLILLCLFRDTSLQEENPRLRRFLVELSSTESINETIRLERLDKRASAELVQSAFKSGRARDDVLDVLYRKSGGNPFFLREILKLLLETGGLTADRDGEWVLEQGRSVKIPNSAKDVIRQKLANLGDDDLEALRLGSVIGEEFSLELLGRVSPAEGKVLQYSLEKGVALGLVEERLTRGGGLAYAFTDEVVMDVLCERIGLARLQNYHLAVAQGIESLHASSTDEYSAELAIHYKFAGRPEKCFEYSLRAGDVASRASAHRDASKHYETAVALLTHNNYNLPHVSQGQLIERLGHELWFSGEGPEACRRWIEAVQEYEAAQDTERAGALHQRVGYYFAVNKASATEAFEEYGKALGYLSQLPPGPGLALLYLQLAELHWWAGQPGPAKENAQKAISIASEFQTHLVESLAHAAIGASSPIGDGENALQHLSYVERFDTTYWQTALDVRNPMNVSRPYAWLAMFGWRNVKGDCRRAKEVLLKAVAFNNEHGSALVNCWMRSWLAQFGYLPLGEWSQARAVLEDDWRQRPVREIPVLRGFVLATLGTLNLLEGNLEEAEELLKESHSLLQDAGLTLWCIVEECHVSLGRLYLAKGDPRRAETYLIEGYRLTRKRGLIVDSAFQFAACARFLVDACLMQGKVNEAHSYVGELRNLANIAHSDWADANFLSASGALASDAEDWKEAQESYEKSVECLKRLAWPYELATTYRRLACVHQEKGETELGTQFSQMAIDLFERLGAKFDVQRIRAERMEDEENQDVLAVLRLSTRGSDRSRAVFSYLSNEFNDDFYLKRLSSEACGWRSFIEIARSIGVPVSTFYVASRGRNLLTDLEKSGLIESRVFQGQRGRGGKTTRLRIAFERDEIRKYLSRKAGKRSRGGRT